MYNIIPRRNLTLFDDFVNEFFSKENSAERSYLPSTDISEDSNNYYLSIDIPGLSVEDIQVNVEKNVLTVSGERKAEQESKEKNYHKIERFYGKFSRSFTLPRNVKADEIDAKYNQGTLQLIVPKAEEAKPRQISVKSV